MDYNALRKVMDMKKRIGVILVLFLAIFSLGIEKAYAKVDYITETSEVKNDDKGYYQEYTIKLKITEVDEKVNTISGQFNLINVVLKDEKDFVLGENWYIDSHNENSYTLGTTLTKLEKDKEYLVATIKYYKIETEKECRVEFIPDAIKPVDRTCTTYQGKLYGKNGEIVDETTYQKECGVNICRNFDDETYFGKDGTEVDKEKYDEECVEKEKHYCEKVEEDYYDKDGNKTTKEKYEKDCFKHSCQIIDGTYFNKDGIVVEKDEYDKDCNTKHYCEKVEDDYYGLFGNIVTSEEYEKECHKEVEKPSCEIVDDKYYDKDGNEITEKEYNLQCKKHSCEIVDDKYFDKDGNEVTKEEYVKMCPNAEKNPNTGSFMPLLPLGILGAGAIAIYFYTKKSDNLV